MSEVGANTRREALISQADPGDFLALMKPRVMSLVVFTALVGLMIAPGPIHPVMALIAVFSIAVGGGASGALNMWYDADIDAIMHRTQGRPIPSGRVTPDEAKAFGLFLSFFSVMVLGLATNWVAAGLLAFTIFFYVVIYTMWLKRSTPQNIVIGGAAGAFPPMIGWAAVTGSIAIEPVILFSIIFLWTPPHFWALALVKNEDYSRAGVPMMPVVAGEARTRLEIVLYTIILTPVALSPLYFGFGGKLYAVTSIIGSLAMLVWAFDIWRNRGGELDRKACWRMFGGSIAYLSCLFAALLIERMAQPFLPAIRALITGAMG